MINFSLLCSNISTLNVVKSGRNEASDHQILLINSFCEIYQIDPSHLNKKIFGPSHLKSITIVPQI